MLTVNFQVNKLDSAVTKPKNPVIMSKRLTAQERYNKERQENRKTVEKIKRSNPSLPKKVTMKTTVNMNRSSSGIGGLLDGLKAKIDILEQGMIHLITDIV